MSLHVYYSTSESTTTTVTWHELDMDAYGFCNPKYKISYSHPREFNFTLFTPSHTTPIPVRSTIIIYDDDYSTDLRYPVFEGHVHNVIPKETLQVDYVCYGQDMRARQEITIMSGPHADSTAIPRLVYNSKIDNDDDRAFEFRHNATVGQMIEDILTHGYNELVSLCEAAPPVTVGGPAYVAGDLAPLDFIPQEKMVFESELLGQGLDRLMAYYPQYRMIFHQGVHSAGRKWRLVNVKTAPAITLTLNSFNSVEKHVLSMSISRSLEQRYTAVKIYGPQQTLVETIYQETTEGNSGTGLISIEGGGLTPLWSLQQELNFQQFGPFGRSDAIGNAGKQWQVTDEDKRRLARILPYEVLISGSQYNVQGTQLLYKRTRRPTFQVTWDNVVWHTVNGVHLDVLNGIITVPYHVWQGANLGESSSGGGASAGSGSFSAGLIGQYAVPVNARFIFAYYTTPLSSRSPSSGWTGTAYTVANLQVEKKIYDEMFAIGYESGGTAVTTSERTTQYGKLCASILESSKDIIYTGGCVIDGIDYDFLNLAKRINFAAVDRHGDPLTTGWEAINGILTDVEYDYEDQSTSLTIASDQMEFTQQDPERMKSILKIHAQTIYTQVNLNIGVGQQLYDYRRIIVEEGPNGQRVVGEL